MVGTYRPPSGAKPVRIACEAVTHAPPRVEMNDMGITLQFIVIYRTAEIKNGQRGIKTTLSIMAICSK